MRRFDVENTNGSLGPSHESLNRSSSSIRRTAANWKVVPSDYVPPIRAMNGLHKPPQPGLSSNSLDPKNLVSAATLLGSVGSLKAAEATEQLNNTGTASAVDEIYAGFDFAFENLVFEGGGNKGMAYVGALQVF